MHKWQSEKLQLAGHMNELTESLRQKDKEAAMNETRLRSKFDQELENVEAGYEEQYDELQNECNKAKNANMFLENNLHQLKLEHEKDNRLLSSSFYHLGLVQVAKDRKNVQSQDSDLDWLEGQKNNVYAHGYESIFRGGM